MSPKNAEPCGWKAAPSAACSVAAKTGGGPTEAEPDDPAMASQSAVTFFRRVIPLLISSATHCCGLTTFFGESEGTGWQSVSARTLACRPGDDNATHTTHSEIDLMYTVRRFLIDTSGATAIEYGLIAAGISVAIIAVVNALGTQLKTTFSSVSTSLANAGN